MEVGRLMQKSIQVKITVAKQDPRVCLKCGTALKPRGEKLTGRYTCPNCPESEGEYIITREFYKDLLTEQKEPIPERRLVDQIREWFVISLKNRNKKLEPAICEICQLVIEGKLAVSFTLTGSRNEHQKHLHLSCAQGIGLKLEGL